MVARIQTIAEARARIEEQDETIRALRATMEPPADAWQGTRAWAAGFRPTRNDRVLLEALRAGRTCTRDMLGARLSLVSVRPTEEHPDAALAIHRLRGRLPFGVLIRSTYGLGYWMTPEDIARLWEPT